MKNMTRSYIEEASDEDIINHLLKNKHYYIAFDSKSQNIQYLKQYKQHLYRRWQTILLLQ